jgi:hypothetical protein
MKENIERNILCKGWGTEGTGEGETGGTELEPETKYENYSLDEWIETRAKTKKKRKVQIS